ncbi:flotillin family protein [Motilibacter deserti]|uniref:Flotillin family protein n=1 Tax=Motilibacter deserti TaxID=2714956 RepID=A0ABX0GX55_9ACTN|nr:flotillin family protein [Motilibacter deserti]NHC15397.1 flotillin family protein [Motilibacter deserti]
MTVRNEILTIVVAVAAIVTVLLLVGLVYAKNYVKVPPNQVAVFTGRGRLRTVRGGARFRVPVIERVDIMQLEPFNVEARVENVYSTNGVPVNVTAVGLIRFGSTEEAIATAVERFLTSDRHSMHNQVAEILAGNMRSIVSQMTVEELNSNRDELKRRVVDEAEAAFEPIGMQLDVLTIQTISDTNGYLEALGQTRIAEVKRDAEIGQANARRDAMIRAASADREGRTAEAEAATQIAQAERERDLELARISALVEAERSRAAQAGPLAEAEARKAVIVAEVAIERQRQEAQIAVEEQRALRAEQAQRADVTVPAEARRQAAVIDAQGLREAVIARAEADARQRELQGQSDARARTYVAEAKQRELEAEAQGERARLLARADGEQALLLAQAEGEKARLLASAEGQAELAEALNAFTTEAARLNVLPQLIAALPEIAQAVAAPMGNIDSMVVLNGGSGGEDAISRVAGSVPTLLLQVLETAKAGGLDLAQLLGAASGSSDVAAVNGQHAGASH